LKIYCKIIRGPITSVSHRVKQKNALTHSSQKTVGQRYFVFPPDHITCVETTVNRLLYC